MLSHQGVLCLLILNHSSSTEMECVLEILIYVCAPSKYIIRPQIRVCNYFFSFFSTETFVVGTQKNRLNEVLLSTQTYV